MERCKMTVQRMAKSGRNKCTKVLCPNEATGSLIGAQGANMKKMEKENTASIRVSKRDETFPGINERVIDIMGNLPALRVCVNTVQEHIRSTVEKGVIPRPRHTYCIIILSDDAAGKIGPGAELLTKKWKVQIEASDRKRMSSLMERWVKVSGAPAQVEGCINEIITMSVEPGIKPMTHGVCYAGIQSTGYADTAQRKQELTVPSASKTGVPLASKTTFHSAIKPAETLNKFSPLSKVSDNPHQYDFNTIAKDQPPGLVTATAQSKINPYRPDSYDNKANKLEEGWQTVTRNRRTSSEAASPDTSHTTRLGELEIKEEYFDLTGYSVYQIINLDNELPVKMMLNKRF